MGSAFIYIWQQQKQNKTKQKSPKPHITKTSRTTADKPQNIEGRRLRPVPSMITVVNSGMQQICCYNRDEN